MLGFVKKVLGKNLVYELKEFRNRNLNKYTKAARDRKKFFANLINPGDLCFDVGANEGFYTETFLELGAKVVAVEPQKSCIYYLKNKFGDQIELVEMGLGAREETRDFYVASASVISSFSKEWIDAVKKKKFKKYSWAEPVKRQITTLDNLIEKYGTPRFIKIDVEGFELEVLKGLSKPVELISFEYTVPELTLRVPECIEQIEKNSSASNCNYSIREEQKFILDKWLTADEMKAYVMTGEFIESGTGDIFIRQNGINE